MRRRVQKNTLHTHHAVETVSSGEEQELDWDGDWLPLYRSRLRCWRAVQKQGTKVGMYLRRVREEVHQTPH